MISEANYKQVLFDYACEKYEARFQEFHNRFYDEFPYKIANMSDELYLENFILLYQLGYGIDILPKYKATFPTNPYNVWYSNYFRPNYLANYTIVILYDATSQENHLLDYRDMMFSIDLTI